MVRYRRALSFAVVLALLLGGLATMAAEGHDRSPDNVLVTIRAGHVEGGKKTVDQTYTMVTSPGGQRVRFMKGMRLPIAVTRFQASTPPNREIVPMTSYTYQDIGFIAEVETRIDTRPGESPRILIFAEIERSSVAGQTEDGSPTIATEHQSVRTVVPDGSSVEVLRIEEAEGKTVYYEIEASIP
jgi:hypothetical protein